MQTRDSGSVTVTVTGSGSRRLALRNGLSKSHLNDIEKGRKAVSPERAARFAKVLGYSQARLVKLALQDLVNRGGLELQVDVTAA